MRLLQTCEFQIAKFRGTARFWKCVFRSRADFNFSVVEPREKGQLDAITNAEANFSFSRFEGAADFLGSDFKGNVVFWRTVFQGKVKLEGCEFKSGVTFEGKRSLVCVEALDFEDVNAFDQLNRSGWLHETDEDLACGDMQEIDSHSKLEERLIASGFSSDRIQQVKTAWSKTQVDMFSQEASFRRAHFGKPECVVFRNVNVNNCYLADSNAGLVRFQNVTRERRPTFLWADQRRFIADEKQAMSAAELRAIGRVYYQLRSTHEEQGLFDEASDFHCGEMEMARLSERHQYMSLGAWYLYLSSYGERPGLALSWLVIAIFIFFPLLYIATGFSHSIGQALLHSLETSTFLEAPKQGVEASNQIVPIVARFVAGFQRIAVPVQAGMFVLAVQRKFGRK